MTLKTIIIQNIICDTNNGVAGQVLNRYCAHTQPSSFSHVMHVAWYPEPLTVNTRSKREVSSHVMMLHIPQ